jgi:hypothetical protein
MKNPDAAHFTRVEKYAGNIYQLYLKALRDIARLLHSLPIDTSKPFNFNDYPAIKHRVDSYILDLTKKVKLQTENGISAEWLQANVKNDEQLNQILKGSRLTEAQKKVYYSRNQDGLKAFLQRKEDGLNLSDRVWLYTNQYKNEIEMAVDVALAEKVSAQNLSQAVRQYLQQPETLFRRVRDKNGVLHLSKRAANYHPGRGVYRSSYKNAMRLAGTEINMAYRTADHTRMNDLPFVKGYKVVTSNNHPVRDICDDLKGEYPKEFLFKGWHPHCRCHVITLMVSDTEYNTIERKLLAGEDISGYKSPTSVENVPKGFDSWIGDNKTRAKGWNSLPYFMRDNPRFVKSSISNPVKRVPEVVIPVLKIDPGAPFELNKNTRQSLIDAGYTISGDIEPYNKIIPGFDLVKFDTEFTSLLKKEGFEIDSKWLKIHDSRINFQIRTKDYRSWNDGDKRIVKGINIERSFYRSSDGLRVEHDYFDVDSSLQGSGFSKKVFQSLYQQYKNAKVKFIKVHANIDVGGYAWGKYGFSIKRPAIEGFPNSRYSFNYRKLDAKEITDAKSMIERYFKTHPKADMFPMNKLAEKKYGKKLLLGTDWSGTIDLSNKKQREVFEDYLSSLKAKK